MGAGMPILDSHHADGTGKQIISQTHTSLSQEHLSPLMTQKVVYENGVSTFTGCFDCAAPRIAMTTIAEIMTAPPTKVELIGVSPITIQTRIGPTMISVSERRLSSTAGRWRAPSVNNKKPRPTWKIPRLML